VAFVGALSDDRFGAALLAALADDGVDVGSVRRVAAPTTLAVAEVEPDGSACYRFHVAGTSAASLADPWIPPGATAVVTGGLALVLEPMADAVTALVAAQPPDVLVVIDVNARPAAVTDRRRYRQRLDAVMRRADVVKVSAEDLRALASVDPANPVADPALADDVGDVAAGLLRHGPRLVLRSAGAAGATIVTTRGRVEVPAPAVDVVDTIGAGDALTGAFVAWWTSHGYGPAELDDLTAVEEAVVAATAVASTVCERRGADPPWRDELTSASWPAPAR
jgi:fructokinase